MAKEATFLISLATEEFVKRICQASQRIAEREKRATVQQRDIGTSRFASRDIMAKIHNAATVVRKADEFIFLEGGC